MSDRKLPTVASLRVEAKALKIPRYYRMRKAELIEAVAAHREYDPADNSRKCYDVAIGALREKHLQARAVRAPSFRKEVIGACELYLGDCRDILPTLGKVDAVVTDPPYGDDATHAGHLSKVLLRSGEPARQALRFDGISAAELEMFARSWCESARRWVVFSCEWKHAHRLDEAGAPQGGAWAGDRACSVSTSTAA